MKKIALFALVVATGIFAACSDSYDDWASPQGYDEQPDSTGIYVAVVAAEPIEMADVEGDTVNIFTPSVIVPEGGTVTKFEVTLDEQVTIDADADGNVLTADLQSAVETIYGKRPEARTMAAVVKVYVDVEGQAFVKSTTTSITVTLTAPFIASAYYLVGDFCGWDEASMIAFTHSDADVYDDPEFTVTFTTDGGQYWKIIPQTNIDSGDFWHEGSDGVVGVEVNGDTSLSGTLVAIEGVQAGEIADAGTYRMTINMMDYTYTIEAVGGDPEIWYILGNEIGDGSWGSTVGVSCVPMSIVDGYMYSTAGKGQLTYTGYFLASGGFKIVRVPGEWDDQWGSSDGGLTPVMNDGGSGNLCVPSDGYYTVDLNTSTNTLTVTPTSAPASTYSVMYIAGTINSWTATEMTPVNTVSGVENHVWSYSVTSDGTDELKFLADTGWSVNWGATAFPAGIGTQDGSNIPVAAGTYTVVFNDIDGFYYFY